MNESIDDPTSRTPTIRRAARAAAAAWLLIASAATAGETGDFTNVVAAEGADPWVIRHDDGWYYGTYSTRSNVVLRRSKTISGLGGAESRVVWEPPPEQAYSKELWAPEIHFLEGKWYVYVAADDGRNANHRMYALENPSKDPFEGRFTLKAKVFDPASDRWAIDGTVLRVGPKLYFIWSGWEGDKDVRQDLYIAPMANPWTLSGPRVRISTPTFPWEVAAGPPTVNEGPESIVRGGRVFLIYSAAGSWSDKYCLGLLSAPADGDLLEPATWRKEPAPVFESGDGVLAPGHASFTTSPDGKEDWIVYHAARFPGAGWTRSIRAQPFHWAADGRPVFGAPTSPARPIAVPSGEPRRLRLQAETVGARRRFDADVERAGDYLLSVRYRTDSSNRDEPTSRHRLIVNGRETAVIDYPSSGADNWSNAFARAALKAGANRIELAPVEGPGQGRIDVDSLDVIVEPLERRP
ncbi:MAG: family 43 glycosylhydrolase [Paludisphaera borealis]|uniref:family 43 glycosylhydrolase n=1 Tax=Paludisphaera borealis TaxID=1387353 RepID=UPI002840016B|nr:family 43 glycosylhydrolase [Paludisphaera borealis]MDR3620166.1 family 43 glycosylhydrolase [Paludisphaera borealis]